MAALAGVGALIKGVDGILGRFKASPEEKAEAHAELIDRVMTYEETRLSEAAATIRAEAQSGSFLAANWRPIAMLTMLALVVMHWLGVTDHNVSETEALELMEIIKLGLGGYVIGRSAEKIVPAAIAASKQGKK